MRVQVNLSNEMVEKVDQYSRKMGVSRSSLCSVLIGQGIMSFDKSMDVLTLVGNKIGDSLFAENALSNFTDDNLTK